MHIAPHLAMRLLSRRGTALLRTSAVAALAAVALGVAALVVVVALMSGYAAALRDGILSGAGHATALPLGVPAEPEVRAVLSRLKALQGVDEVGEVVFLPGLMLGEGGERAELVQVKASTVVPSFVRLAGGTPTGPLAIALGVGVARRLGAAAGTPVSLQLVVGGGSPRTLPARVAAVFRTGFAELDERWIVSRLSDLKARVPDLPAGGIEIFLQDPDQADRRSDALQAACGARFLVTTWQQANRNLFAALRWQKISLAVVLSLVVGVGAFEVASALVVLVTEKRKEIGVILALGGEPGLVRRTLLVAGCALGGLGVLCGLAFGVVLAVVLNALGVPKFPPEIAGIYLVDRIPFLVRPAELLLVMVLGLLEVFVVSLVPAVRTAARQPVEVLRWV